MYKYILYMWHVIYIYTDYQVVLESMVLFSDFLDGLQYEMCVSQETILPFCLRFFAH